MLTRDSKDFISSIARCMDVIKTFDGENVEMTPADVAIKAKLTRATARRILLTLATLGYVSTDGKWFRLSPKILDLGFAYLSSMQVSEVIQPVINEAGKNVGETCALSVLDGHDVISVAHSLTDRFARVSFYPGTHLPAYISAGGRVILANQSKEKVDAYFKDLKIKHFTDKTITSKHNLRKELVKIREQGYATVNEELELGLNTLAAPIFNESGDPIAAVTFGGNSIRINDENIGKKFLPELLEVTKKIASVLPSSHSII